VDAAIPYIKFEHNYVHKNPEFSFVVGDRGGAGVDKRSFWIDLYEANYGDPLSLFDDKRIGTFTPDNIDDMWDNDSTVHVTTTLDLSFGTKYLDVIIYDGHYHHECDDYYDSYLCIREYDDGISDCVGNEGKYVWQRFTIDATAPVIDTVITQLPDGCYRVAVSDDESGVASVVVYQNGEAIESQYSGGFLTYCPTPGSEVKIVAVDNVGNETGEFQPVEEEEEDHLTLTRPHNEPNPFDPCGDGYTAIVFDLSKTADVTIKIYDFAGEHVATLKQSESMGPGETVNWYGQADDGSEVANGVYLAHVLATDGSKTVSAVIKIAVLKKD
jgi:hypothetical protein